jgi:hypothetical protein
MIEDFPIVLDDEHRYELESTPDMKGLLMIRDPDGSSRAIAIRIGDAYPESEDDEDNDIDEDPEPLFVNPLTTIDAAELLELRGVVVAGWEEGLDDLLRETDLQSLAVAVTGEAFPDQRVPPLPPSLRYLLIQASASAAVQDFSALGQMDQLQLLWVSSCHSGVPIDIDLLGSSGALRFLNVGFEKLTDMVGLAELRDLRHLNLSGCEAVTNETLAALAGLAELRFLDLSYCKNLSDIEALSGLSQLRELKLFETPVADLSPLGRLSGLRRVFASRSGVRVLPTVPMPELTELNVMSTKLDEAAVGRFRELNPRCTVRFRWIDALRNNLGGVNRVRVRTGGTCHRNEECEQTLCEENDPGKIQRLVDCLDIDESHSSGHCMCCGHPTIEFCKGEEVIESLGLHHGRSARWNSWPGDGGLTPVSRDALSRWLTDRGETSFAAAHEESRNYEKASQRLWEDYARFVPPGLLDAARDPDFEEFAEQAKKEVKNAVARGEMAFRLLGCGQGTWNLYYLPGLQSEGLELLDSLSPRKRARALSRASDDPLIAEGAARWLFFRGEFDSIPEKFLRKHIEHLTMLGLTHPRPFNRRHTIQVLGQFEGDFGTFMLRRVLEGLTPRELDSGEEFEPPGQMVHQGGEPDVPESCSDPVRAAFILARRGDLGSRAQIEELRRCATGEEHEFLERAVEMLERGGSDA